MTINEKVRDKEKAVKALIDELRQLLNAGRQQHDKTPQSWQYISSLGITETKLQELIDYLKQSV